jgi:HEAT repeat protein
VLLTFAERFRDALVPFLAIGSAVLLILLVTLIGQRLIRAAIEARRKSLLARYGPAIDAALASASPQSIAALERIPKRHREIVAEVVLATLRIVRGVQNERARDIAQRFDLMAQWRDDLASRMWWRRSEAALALGLLRDKKSVPLLTPLLDDEHEQVRAAVIDALGQIGDVWAIGPLLARISDPTRHERARLVQALRAFGENASRALVEHGTRNEKDRAVVADVLSFVGGAGASDSLLEWSTARDSDTRAAVWSALAKIGVDERGFYHAIKALGASEPPVRAAAARALARTGRADAVPYLSSKLDDAWEVSAVCALLLARLGPPGVQALKERVASGDGLGHDLARQVLWESGQR